MSNQTTRRDFLKTAVVAGYGAGFAGLAGEAPGAGEAVPTDPPAKIEKAVSLRAAVTLQNAQVRLSVSADGRLAELTNVHNGQNYAGGEPLWAMFYREGDSWENAVKVEAIPPEVTQEGDVLRLRYHGLQGSSKPLAAQLELEARLVGDEVHFSAALTNHDPDVTITELHFPLVGACRFRNDQALICSDQGGHRFEHVRDRIRRSRGAAYMGSDQHGIKMTAVYPSYNASTNSFVFAGQEDGLYFGSHDPTFQKTVHLLSLMDEEVTAGFVKFPFADKGQSFSVDNYVISPYSGSWHVPAKKYRAFADSWFKPAVKPKWVENMTGWQRVILKHQYGEILHPYSEIPQIAADGLSAGIQGLLLFGWWKGGMDNDYPNYICDESQGGRTALIDQIRRAQSQGAKVMLYFQGVFINAESEYCAKDGCPVAVKDIWGTRPEAHFAFTGDGVLTQSFCKKTFFYGCPGAKEWRDMLKQFADKAVEFGMDSVFYDSMGAAIDYPCAVESHGHPVPFMTSSAARADLFRELREHIKAANPDMGLGTEGLTDVLSQYADFIHWIGNVGTVYTEGKAGSKPKTENFMEWFRYIFPEVIVSDREIYDDQDVERRVNRALMLGLRSDVDVWRCRGTIRDTVLYRAYLTKADALRMKFAELIMSGRFSDTESFTLSNAAVDARSFRAGNRTAVVLTQNYLQNATTNLSVPGYSLVDQGGLGQYSVTASADSARVDLAKNALAVAVFTKT